MFTGRSHLHRIKVQGGSHLHRIKVQGEAASYPEDPAKIINKGGYPKQQMFNVAEIAL